MKIFTKIIDKGTNSQIICGKNINLTGCVQGNNNKIIIKDSNKPSFIEISLNGNNNTIEIDESSRITKLNIISGKHVKTNNIKLKIGKNVLFSGAASILMPNTNNICEIGSNCVISDATCIRCGEWPHLIFDMETGEYLDNSEGVFIKDNVWIGSNVFITKRVTIEEGSIVGTRSVVTRRFDEKNVVIAGNPATITRRNVKWFRNQKCLPSEGKYVLPDAFL